MKKLIVALWICWHSVVALCTEHSSEVTLSTDRLTLREVRLSDAGSIYSLSQDTDVVRYTPFDLASRSEADKWARQTINGAQGPRSVYKLIAVDTQSGNFVGFASLKIESLEHKRGEITLLVQKGDWKKGFGYEMAQALLKFAFQSLDLYRISATAAPENHSSIALLHKVGMQYEGRMCSHLFMRGARRDSLLFSILKPSWVQAEAVRNAIK